MRQQLKKKRIGRLVAGVILASAVVWQCAAPGKPAARLKFAVSFPAEQSKTPLDGRVLLLISNDGSPEPRYQINDTAKTQLIFGIDVDELAPGQGGGRRRHGLRLSPPEHRRDPRREILRPGAAQQIRNVSSRRRPHRQTSARPGRRPALERETRQSLQHAAKYRIDPAKNETIKITLDKDHPAHRAAQGHEIHQARTHPKQAPHRVLGPADGRSAPASCFPKGSTSIRTPTTRSSSITAIFHTRSKVSARAARPQPQAGLQRAVPPRRLQ